MQFVHSRWTMVSWERTQCLYGGFACFVTQWILTYWARIVSIAYWRVISTSSRRETISSRCPSWMKSWNSWRFISYGELVFWSLYGERLGIQCLLVLKTKALFRQVAVSIGLGSRESLRVTQAPVVRESYCCTDGKHKVSRWLLLTDLSDQTDSFRRWKMSDLCKGDRLTRLLPNRGETRSAPRVPTQRREICLLLSTITKLRSSTSLSLARADCQKCTAI